MTDWLQLASDSFESSTSFVDTNYRKKWEDNIRMHQNEHPQGSKYLSDAYKHRSRLFRPKSRSVVRKNEATASAAYFANMDVVSVEATDDSNDQQIASAAIMKEIMQHRLTKTIPWFQVLIGAFQEAQVVGVVCSYQYWKYKEVEETKSVYVPDPFTGEPIIDENGEPVTEQIKASRVIEDEPCIELWPVENIRIDPSANWLNPIKSSPYVIRMIPMYAQDVKSLMEKENPKTGMPKFIKYDDGEIRIAVNSQNDSTRQQREVNREDSKQSHKPVGGFEIVWVHENFIRLEGQEYVYYTLGTHKLLTQPKPLEDVYFHGERPIVMGVSMIEAHKIYPESVVGVGAPLQREANDIVNQRLDNVKLVLNKRWKVKRGKQVDINSLLRNAAGSVTMLTDMADIEEINWPDVTSSSYAEQDRVNVDYDELVGNFSSGSVQTNRKMNETVGGLGLIASGANQMTEYLIRTFNETWVEPVLRQLVKLEQAYETDEVVLSLAAGKADLFQRYGVDEVTDELLNQELTLTVNVGVGATDPNLKLQKFLMGLNSFRDIATNPPPNANLEEIAKEIFGHLGYKNGKRFFVDDIDPMVAQLTQQVQALQQALQSKEMDHQAKLAEKQLDTQIEMVMQEKDLAFQYDKLQAETGLQLLNAQR